jgi:molybdopterin-guanine dinucleotide biosynthesis protein A/molybdopterin converting factor small subunit
MTAIVLAGGRSSRMGTPKALLPFDGEPLIVHIVRSLQSRFSDIVVVAAPGQQLPSLPVTLVHDDVAYQGPVGGILYGLRAARGSHAFVTSCDSAFLSPTLIDYLLSLKEDYDVVVPRWEDRFQPLMAVYSKGVLPVLETQLANGQLRPVSLFTKVRTREVSEEEVRRVDPEGASFFNMNTPADYEEVQKRWAARRDAAGATVGCTVELFGVARLLTGMREINLALRPDATIADVFEALSGKLPSLSGRVISADGTRLVDGYACNVNGLEFVRSADARVKPGDNIAIISADAGG